MLEDLVDNEVVHGGLVQRNPDGSVENLPSPDRVLFACLAPDGTSIVFTTDIGGGGLIAPGRGDWIEIDGSFAGWMEVDP